MRVVSSVERASCTLTLTAGPAADAAGSARSATTPTEDPWRPGRGEPRGRLDWAWTVAILVVLAAISAVLGVRQVDDGFRPRYTTLDLRHPEGFVAGASVVGPSEIGYLGWHGPDPLVIRGISVRRGDLLKAKVFAECGRGELGVRVGTGAPSRVSAKAEWRQVELPLGNEGTEIVWEKFTPQPCTVHFSRMTVAGFYGEATGVFEGHLVAERRVPSSALWDPRLAGAAVPLLVFGLIWLWGILVVQAPRRRCRRIAIRTAALPVLVLLAFEAYGAVTGRWLVTPGRTPLALFAAAAAVVMAVGAGARFDPGGRVIRAAARRLVASITQAEDEIAVATRCNGVADSTSVQSRGRRFAVGSLGLLALLLYGYLLFVSRPVTPFEWDEVLALSGVVKFDVAAHSPQPPGFPAYIAAGKAVRFLVGDPFLALQVVGILAALGALAATWALARRLGAPPLTSAAAAAIVGTSPEFLYSAAVGISDVSGAAAGVAAVLALVTAVERPSWLPLAGAACGLAFGIRPQTAAVLVPALAWASVAAGRSGRWRNLAFGALTGIATAAVCWVPAIVATGPRRWWDAAVGHIRAMGVIEHTLRLPAAPLSEICGYWFLGSFVDWQFAVPLWLLVIAGTVVLVRTGRARLAALAGATAGIYMLSAMLTMNETVSLRYILPALPFVAILASGGLAAPNRVARRAFATLAALWCLAAIAWTSPALRERQRPSPTWAALTWIREHCDPSTTRVRYDVVFAPHVYYVLQKAGFSTFEAEKASIPNHWEAPDEQTLLVTPLPVPGAEVLFQGRQETDRVVRLAWGRYGSCAVSRVRRTGEAVYSPEWRRAKEGWQLRGTGHIALPEESKPAIVRLCAGAEEIMLRRQSSPPETIAARQCVTARLIRGPEDVLTVTAPDDSGAIMPPIQFLPLAALDPEGAVASAYLVPQAAHRHGYGDAVWRTDLVVINPNTSPLTIAVQFLATLQDNTAAPSVLRTLRPGELFTFPDVLTLPEFRDAGTLGALLVRSLNDPIGCRGPGCRFTALSRTYGSPTGVWRAEEWLPGVAPGAALRPGETAVLSHVTHTERIGASIGVASWSDRPAHVVARVLDPSGAVVETETVDLPPFGHRYFPVRAAVEDGRVEVVLDGAAEGGLVVPYGSMVARRTGLSWHILPDRGSPHVLPDEWRPPIPKSPTAS